MRSGNVLPLGIAALAFAGLALFDGCEEPLPGCVPNGPSIEASNVVPSSVATERSASLVALETEGFLEPEISMNCWLAGFVRDASSGLPIAGAEIAILESGRVERPFIARSGSDGSYRIETSTSFVDAELAVRAPSCVERFHEIGALTVGRNERDFLVGRVPFLRGRVRDIDSLDPVAGKRIEVVRLGGGVIARSTSARDGWFEIFWDPSIDRAAVEEQEFLDVCVAGDESEVEPAYFGSRTRCATERVRSGEPIELVVGRYRAIEGRVLDHHGLPFRFAYLEISAPTSGDWDDLLEPWRTHEEMLPGERVLPLPVERSVARTDVEGRFRLVSLVPAAAMRCVVIARPTSPQCPRLSFAVGSLVAGERKDVEFVMPDPATVIDGVVTRDGWATHGVVEWRSDRLFGSIATDRYGRFHVEGIDPGRLELFARSNHGFVGAKTSISIAYGERTERNLELGDPIAVAETAATDEIAPLAARD